MRHNQYNVCISGEEVLLDTIRVYQEREDITHFNNAVTKLLKIALRSEGLLENLTVTQTLEKHKKLAIKKAGKSQ